MAYPRYEVARAFRIGTSVAAGSDYTITSTFAVVDATNLSHSIEAQVGDVLEMIFQFTMAAGGGEFIHADFGINGTRIGDATAGSLQDDIPSSIPRTHALYRCHTVVSGDIVAGVVTGRPWAKTSGTSRSMKYLAPPATFTMKNLGPADPE